MRRLLSSPLLQRLLRDGYHVEDWGVDYDEDYDGDDEGGRPIIIPTASPWLVICRPVRDDVMPYTLRFYGSRWGGTAAYVDGLPCGRIWADPPEAFDLEATRSGGGRARVLP